MKYGGSVSKEKVSIHMLIIVVMVMCCVVDLHAVSIKGQCEYNVSLVNNLTEREGTNEKR